MISTRTPIECLKRIYNILPLTPLGKGQPINHLTPIDTTPNHRINDIGSRSYIAKQSFVTCQMLLSRE